MLTPEQIAKLRAARAAIGGPFSTASSMPREQAYARDVYLKLLEAHAPALLDAAERCVEHDARKAMATAPCDHATKAFVFSAGEDAPGKSLDTISQCKVCGAIIRDYRHGGGMTSPNYPMITPSPLTVPFLQLAQQLIESERERDELRNKVEALVPEWDYALGGAAQAHSHAVCPNCDNGDSIRAERDAATRERDEMARELERAREAMKKLHPRPSHGLLGDIGCVADRVGSNSDAWEELLRERDAASARAEAAEKERDEIVSAIIGHDDEDMKHDPKSVAQLVKDVLVERDDLARRLGGATAALLALRKWVDEYSDLVAAVRGACALALRWLGDPDDPNGTFEDIGAWYQRETGRLRPGKSLPMAMAGVSDEDREKHFCAWADAKGREVRAALKSAGGGDHAKGGG